MINCHFVVKVRFIFGFILKDATRDWWRCYAFELRVAKFACLASCHDYIESILGSWHFWPLFSDKSHSDALKGTAHRVRSQR